MDKTGVDKKDVIFVAVFFSMLISLIGIISIIALANSSFQKDRVKMSELLITNLEFTIGDASTGKIIIHVINSGDYEVTVSEIKVNKQTVSSWEATNSPTLTIGATETFTVTHEIIADTKYYIWLFSTEGHLVGSYTETA